MRVVVREEWGVETCGGLLERRLERVCAKCAFVIVLLELDANKQLSFPIDCDFVVFLEGCDEMLRVSVTCELDAEIVNHKSEGDRAPCMLPESWSNLNGIISCPIYARTLEARMASYHLYSRR